MDGFSKVHETTSLNSHHSTTENGLCSNQELDEAVERFLVAETVGRYFYAITSVISIVLNVRQLVLTCKLGRKSGMLDSKLTILATMNLITVVSMMINNAEIWFETTGTDVTKTAGDIVFCKLPTYLYQVSNFTSSWVVTSIAVQRYVVIKYPLTAVKYTKKAMWIELATLIIIPILSVSPKLITVENVTAAPGVVVCIPRHEPQVIYELDTYYTILLFILSTVLPVSALIVVTALLFMQLEKARQESLRLTNRIGEEACLSFQISAAQFMHNTIMTLVLSATYTLLQIPDAVLWLMDRAVVKSLSNLCAFINIHTVFSYMSLLHCIVAVSNPAVFLVFRWYSDRVTKRTVFRHKTLTASSSCPSARPTESTQHL